MSESYPCPQRYVWRLYNLKLNTWIKHYILLILETWDLDAFHESGVWKAIRHATYDLLVQRARIKNLCQTKRWGHSAKFISHLHSTNDKKTVTVCNGLSVTLKIQNVLPTCVRDCRILAFGQHLYFLWFGRCLEDFYQGEFKNFRFKVDHVRPTFLYWWGMLLMP